MATNSRKNEGQWTSAEPAGFALLMTLVVVGVVLSIGISMLDLAKKQVRLSTNVKESEKAFHATNAGMECARYWRREEADAMELGGSFTPVCFDTSAGTVNPSTEFVPQVDDDADADAFYYTYSFTWGAGAAARCTQINTMVASTTITGDGVVVQNMTTLFPGYPDGDNFSCENGARCSIISVRGYNKPCASINTYGTVQREVLLEL